MHIISTLSIFALAASLTLGRSHSKVFIHDGYIGTNSDTQASGSASFPTSTGRNGTQVNGTSTYYMPSLSASTSASLVTPASSIANAAISSSNAVTSSSDKNPSPIYVYMCGDHLYRENSKSTPGYTAKKKAGHAHTTKTTHTTTFETVVRTTTAQITMDAYGQHKRMGPWNRVGGQKTPTHSPGYEMPEGRSYEAREHWLDMERSASIQAHSAYFASKSTETVSVPPQRPTDLPASQTLPFVQPSKRAETASFKPPQVYNDMEVSPQSVRDVEELDTRSPVDTSGTELPDDGQECPKGAAYGWYVFTHFHKPPCHKTGSRRSPVDARRIEM